MSWIEDDIARYERRIKRIQENPDPSMLNCTQILYELERDKRKEQLRAWKAGEPFSYGQGAVGTGILEALGFHDWDGPTTADRQAKLAPEYFRVARAAGYPDHACDRAIVSVAMALKGDVPPPSFVVSSNYACGAHMWNKVALARHFRVPWFMVDTHFESNQKSLEYVAAQLGELINYAEANVPGIKYDEKKLDRLHRIGREAHQYMWEVEQFKKAVPCPITGRDTFRLPAVSPSIDPDKYLHYYRSFRDELKGRVEKGQGALPHERMRVGWLVTGVFYADPFSFLESMGVSVPFFAAGRAWDPRGPQYKVFGDDAEYGRKLTPLEEEARQLNALVWGGLADRWIDDVLLQCKEYKLDALVHFAQSGCTVTLGVEKVLAERAEKEIGVPTLLIEGRMLDNEAYNEREFQARLEDFVEMCLQNKG